MKRKVLYFVMMVAMLLSMAAPVMADGGLTPQFEAPVKTQVATGTYIVYFEDPALPTYTGGIPGLQATSPAKTGAAKLDVNAPASVMYVNYLKNEQSAFLAQAEKVFGRTLSPTFQYQIAINGMALELTVGEAELMEKMDGVLAVVPEWTDYAQTDQGPGWIGAFEVWSGEDAPGGVGTMGEGMIVGVLDTGINADHPSFSDDPADYNDDYAYTWDGDYLGWCAPDSSHYTDTVGMCNDKLIGVWSGDEDTPEDYNGHGSHTGSTAAGNMITASITTPAGASIEYAISGVAPHAHLIAYNIEGAQGGGSAPGASIIAATEQAIADGVDVINYSFGSDSQTDPWLAAEHWRQVYAAGIFAATSAGNAGNGFATVGTPAGAPWMMTVANASHPRNIQNALVNIGPDGLDDMVGKGFTGGYGPAPIVNAAWYSDVFTQAVEVEGTLCQPAELASQCLIPFPAGTFDGEIVVCERAIIARVDKAINAAAGGAGGFVLYNPTPNFLAGDAYTIPGVHLDHTNGLALVGWLTNTVVQTATITGYEIDIANDNADIVSYSSSRGPGAVLDVLKPDITAPGSDILAAVADSGATEDVAEFDLYSGTSMASPHVAGAAVLVRKLHPDWTPAEVQSALSSTSSQEYTRDTFGGEADPFDIGAGSARVNNAVRAGFVLDENADNMLAADPAMGGDPTALNLATLANGQCVPGAECVWTRTLKGVVNETWTVSVVTSTGLALSVEPATFALNAGEEQVVTITADATDVPVETWAFGQVKFEPAGDDTPSAHFPVAVKAVAAVLPGAVTEMTTDAVGSRMLSGFQSASDITELTLSAYGLVQGDLTMEYLNQDSNPGNFSLRNNPADGNLVVTTEITDTDTRLVVQILDTTSPDLDLYVYFTTDGVNFGRAGYSATGATLEYVSVDSPPPGFYFIIVQNYSASAGVDPDDPTTWDPVVLATAVVPGTVPTHGRAAPTADNFTVTGPSGPIPAGDTFDVTFAWDFDMWKGNNYGVPNVWYGGFTLGTDADPEHSANIGWVPVDIVQQPLVRLEKTVMTENTPVKLGDMVTYTLSLYASVPATVWITDALPSGVTGVGFSGEVEIGPEETATLGVPVWVRHIPVTVGTDGATLYGQEIVNVAYLDYNGTISSAAASFTVESAMVYLPLVMRNYPAATP